MNKWLKIALGLLLGFIVVAAAGSFFVMKSMGIIPNNDFEVFSNMK